MKLKSPWSVRLLEVVYHLAGLVADQARLEEADTAFLRHARSFLESVATLGDLRELRRRSSAPCSHWWWYLEKFAQRQPVEV